MRLGARSKSMKENKLEVIIGAIVLTVALGFVVFIYQSTGLSVSNSRHYELKADFRSADGIHVGTDVRLAGVKVGTVSDLSLNVCLLYTSPSPRDISGSRMPSSA